jgi:hypothetical protein
MRADLQPTSDELELLQARIGALEAELLQLEASANRAVAEAQEKAYWLDRWRIDINAIMDRNATQRVLAAAQGARAVYRTVVRMKRKVT